MASPDDSDGLPDSDDEGAERRRKPMSRQTTRRRVKAKKRPKNMQIKIHEIQITIRTGVKLQKHIDLKDSGSAQPLTDFLNPGKSSAEPENCIKLKQIERVSCTSGCPSEVEVLVEFWRKEVKIKAKAPSLELSAEALEALERHSALRLRGFASLSVCAAEMETLRSSRNSIEFCCLINTEAGLDRFDPLFFPYNSQNKTKMH